MPWFHKKAKRVWDYWHGKPVKVIKGPFRGLEGQAIGADGNRTCVYFFSAEPHGFQGIWMDVALLHRIEPEELA